jgi:hypothetical protein
MGFGGIGGVEKDFAGVVDFLEIAFGEFCEVFGEFGEEDELAEVGKGGGALVGDAVGDEAEEDFLEGAVDVQIFVGERIEAFYERGEIGLGGGLLAGEFIVGIAIAVGRGVAGGHGALASIGEFVLAKDAVGRSLSFGSHNKSIETRQDTDK